MMNFERVGVPTRGSGVVLFRQYRRQRNEVTRELEKPRYSSSSNVSRLKKKLVG
jgi:hypothetical protein